MGVQMPLRPDETAPYGPPAAVLGVIHLFRERGLATPFTTDVLIRAGVSESLVPRVLQSLKVLELIDEQGAPTPHLEGLRKATTEDFKPRLAEVIKAVYADVFQFTDPAKDDAGRIGDAFRSYKPAGQRGRMVTLFVGLCEEAGIIPEGKKPVIGAGRAPSSTPTRSPRRSGHSGPSVSAKAQLRNQADGFIPPAVSGLLASLPSEKEGWTQERRDKWITTFTTVLDFSFPIQEENEDEEKDEE